LDDDVSDRDDVNDDDDSRESSLLFARER